MSASCRVCGRQVEVSDSGQEMPCSCIKTPLGDVLRYILADCVGPDEAREVEAEYAADRFVPGGGER